MKIESRLALLLGAVLALSSLAFVVFRQSNVRETRLMIASIEQERGELLDHLLELTGQSLEQFANDYSYWDEMLKFVGTGDPNWAKINIEASLPDMNAQLAWVLRPDGTQLYGLSRLAGAALQTSPIAAADLVALTQSDHFPHFYLDSPAGLLELRGAPIQPSADVVRATPPRGWFFVGRLWDDAFLRSLASVTHDEVLLTPDAREPTVRRDSPLSINLHRNLCDWQGRPLRVLHLHHHPAPLERLLSDNKTDSYIFLLFGLALAGLLTFTAHFWFAQPLQRLTDSLLRRDVTPLAKLTARSDEFGTLARQVEKSFADQAALNREIEERRRIEVALRESEANLRHAMELRTRLGRDLHDGVIQSIYATGLGLEGVRGLLRTDPAAADRQLDLALKHLNATIWDVRNFITGLEPEAQPREPFAQTLAALVKTIQPARSMRLTLQLDEALARQLSPRQEVHALQVAREALSNALRHGQPSAIEISLSRTDGAPTLAICDDGVGFDPAKRAGTGQGLTNLVARAAEIGATLTLDSAPGKGTRVALRFVSA